jgi:hypothetical protein
MAFWRRGIPKVLSLGPMPDAVRAAVQRLVAEARLKRWHADERLNGFSLTGGPGGASFIDSDGEVWNWFYDGSGESIAHVPDGPMKVGLVAIAAERVPELAAWLPARPQAAKECGVCHGSCHLPPPASLIQCPECKGLGWLE